MELLETLEEIRNAEELVQNVKSVLGFGERPRVVYPRFQKALREFLEENSLEDFLRLISLKMASDEMKEILKDRDMKGWAVFPGDIALDVVYLLDAYVYPFEFSPVFELLDIVGKVERSEKCVIVLPGALGVELPTKIRSKLISYRHKLIRRCSRIALVGGVEDEKHTLSVRSHVESFKSAGKRSDGTFLFLVVFSEDGKISPISVPARLSGGLLEELSDAWKPLGTRFETVRYSREKSDGIEARLVKVSSIEDGKVISKEERRRVDPKGVLGKGDVVVNLRGKSFKVGVIAENGAFTPDPNVLGIRTGDVSVGRALVEYLNFPPVRRAVEEQMIRTVNPPKIPTPLILSIPVPDDLIAVSRLLEDSVSRFRKEMEMLESEMLADLVEIAATRSNL